MEELLVAITRGLVDQPDAVTVEVDQPDEEGVIVYHLHCLLYTSPSPRD